MLDNMNSEIIGRKKECDRLDECMNADQAQLVIVYGRRRVGKTYLINEYFENRFAFKITGAYGQPKEVQLKIFDTSLSRQKRNNKLNSKDWFDAFNNLRVYIYDITT